MIGVDYGLFWELNPTTFHPFVKAFELKNKQRDAELWKQGLYIRLAVASCLSKDCKYPTSPLGKSGSAKDEIKRKFINQMSIINSRIKKG